jgi:hypothetical protein
MLRCKISSNIQDLNELHKQYWWIPNENMIRPDEKILDEKRRFNIYVLNNWLNYKEFIIDKYFKDISGLEWAFVKSLFPYNLVNGVNHYILWNSKFDYFVELEESKINNIIKDTLKNIVGSDSFDFVWYKNPKPSIPELWHIQVFWIRLFH